MLPTLLLGVTACRAASVPDENPTDDHRLVTVLARLSDPSSFPQLTEARMLLQQLSVVTEAERGILDQAFDESLAESSLVRAALLHTLLHDVETEDQEGSAQTRRAALRAALTSAPAPQRASTLAVLADAESHPVLARELAKSAVIAETAARLYPDRPDSLRVDLTGVSMSAAQSLLEEIDRAYHRPVPWAECTQLARQALHRLRDDARVVQQWPKLRTVAGPLAPALDLDSAKADLQWHVTAYRAAGLTEPAIIDLWTRAALAALDAWTRPVWPAEIEGWSAHHSGTLVGTGLSLAAAPSGEPVVQDLALASPAWTAGVHQGDILVQIGDGEKTIDLTDVAAGDVVDRANQGLMGPAGTVLTLSINRGDEHHSLEVVRGSYLQPTVFGWIRNSDNSHDLMFDRSAGTAYIQISTFKPHSETEFDALLDAETDPIRSIILDLRSNAGGDINAAVQIADRFIASGTLATLEGRAPPQPKDTVDPTTGQPLIPWNQAVAGHRLETQPIAVLVDRETASAAEILAGTLQELRNATVIGQPTWGKGFAQALHTAEDGSYGLEYTNAAWALPSGRELGRTATNTGGIQPDLFLSLGPAARYQLSELARRRTAARAHVDGTPMTVHERVVREDLPPLPDDPAVTSAAVLLAAGITTTSSSD